jgi:hypothetical protein
MVLEVILKYKSIDKLYYNIANEANKQSQQINQSK